MATEVEKVRIPVPGAEALAAVVTAPDGEPGAVVVLWPALGVPAGYYAPFCGELAARGVAAVAVDLRGQGESGPRSGRGSTHGYHALAARDVPAVTAAVRERFGAGTPLVLLGHSIGGQAAVLAAAREPKAVDGLVLVASGSVDFRGFPGAARWRVLASSQLLALVATVWGYWPGHRLGFGGRQPARLMRDWARLGRTGRFAPAGADLDYEQALAALELPVLAVSLPGDRLAPPGAVDRLVAKLPAAAVERRHHTPADGESADHVRWARAGGGIADLVAGWLPGR
ncbi:alpha/beta fold hydrolase [Kitasatospora sp. NPDC059646]|uniref:alpha/beta hydrolase family protein n=1 Tax=Kitasatospora sp. NPDC059646 TaxID=3346893 RepID=UPI003698771F